LTPFLAPRLAPFLAPRLADFFAAAFLVAFFFLVAFLRAAMMFSVDATGRPVWGKRVNVTEGVTLSGNAMILNIKHAMRQRGNAKFGRYFGIWGKFR